MKNLVKNEIELTDQNITLNLDSVQTPGKVERAINCQLEFTGVNGKTRNADFPFKKCHVTRMFYEYPLRLMIPKHASDNVCQWVYNVVYGGGLVSGDEVSIDVNVKDNCCVLWTSQSFQKVYISGEKGPCYQNLKFQVGSESILAVLADPIVCYRDAKFCQTQEARLTKNSNLILLDWFTAGRSARGEWWSFKSLFSSVTVFIDDDLVLRENLELSNTPLMEVKDAMGDFGVVGSCLIIGPFLNQLSQSLTTELNARCDIGVKTQSHCLLTASPLYIRHPVSNQKETIGCILRIGAVNSSSAYRELSRIFSPLEPIFGDNPFANKY